jgi:hypothetical protein
MGHVTYEYNKERIKQWRTDNQDAFRELNRKHAKTFYTKKKQIISSKKSYSICLGELKNRFTNHLG